MITYIIHVSTAIEREKHMLKELSATNCIQDYEFVNDGDIKDINPDEARKYFKLSEENEITAALSCAYKHFLVYQKLSENIDAFAMVLEDDLHLDKDFCQHLEKFIHEIKRDGISNYIVSLEESNLKYVNYSELQENKSLYRRRQGRFTGAYIIDAEAAKNILKAALAKPCDRPIDLYHNWCAEQNIINIYWAHPTIAMQGSINGTMKTLIGEKRFGFKRALSHKIQRIYKRMLHRLR